MSNWRNMTPEQRARKYAKDAESKKRRLESMTQDQIAYSKLKKSEYDKQMRLINGDKIREKDRVRYAENREKVSIQSKCRYAKNPEKFREIGRIEYRKNPTSIKRSASRRKKESVKAIGDLYISELTGLPVNILRDHPDLLESKRNQIKTHRILKQLKEQTNEENTKQHD